MSNQDRLVQAGLIESGYEFSVEDQSILDSLSTEEVDSLISVKGKVGGDFLTRNTSGSNPPVGIVF
jgi:hypothetical protein